MVQNGLLANPVEREHICFRKVRKSMKLPVLAGIDNPRLPLDCVAGVGTATCFGRLPTLSLELPVFAWCVAARHYVQVMEPTFDGPRALPKKRCSKRTNQVAGRRKKNKKPLYLRGFAKGCHSLHSL